MGKNSKATSAIRDKNMRSISSIAGAPNTGIPVPGAGYSDNSLTQAGSAIGKAIKQYRDDNLAINARMGGSAERTEADFQAQREQERQDMTDNMRQFGDDNEHLGIMGASMGGSRTFTKREVKKGFRKL